MRITRKNPVASAKDSIRPLVWNGTSWPDRPADTRATIFLGGDESTDAPTDADRGAGDLWVPMP